MTQKILAMKNTEHLCWKCLKKKENIHVIEFGPLGYGSGFDCSSTKIQLCDDCFKESERIWSQELVYDSEEDKEYDWCHYEFEDEIFKYFDSLPIEGRQFVWNEFYEGEIKLEPQDWIDYELGILPHEKAKEYGLYSTQEINAYNERFPKCKHPVNRIFSDKSKGCWCPFGATGKYGQEIGLNICSDCYQCEHYEERKKDNPIIDISNDAYKDYVILVKADAILKRMNGQKK